MTSFSSRSEPWQRGLLVNALGMLLPIVASLAALPVLLQYFGAARFGAFALVLAVLAYLSVLDFGLGTALTYRVAALLRDGAPETQVAVLVRTAAIAAGAAGLVFGAVAFFAAGSLAAIIFEQQPELQREVVPCLKILALALPAIFVYGVTSGLLSAHGEFGKLNLTRVPAGLLNALLPALAAFWWNDLAIAAWLLLLVRHAAAAAQLLQCIRLQPQLARHEGLLWSPEALRTLVGFGGWLAVSNVVGPFMVYMDRFYLARATSAVQVGHYVAGYELASKILLLPALVLPVFFPMFVRSLASKKAQDSDLAVGLSAVMLVAAAVPACAAAAFAPELFRFWMRGMVPEVTLVAFQVLSGAAIVNCVAQVFFTRVQALGRTDLIARVHVAELVAYGVVLWWLTSIHGVLGAAIAWAARVAVDIIVFCALATPQLPRIGAHRLWRLCAAALAVGAAVAATSQVSHLGLRTLAFVAPLAFALAWRDELKTFLQARGEQPVDLAVS